MSDTASRGRRSDGENNTEYAALFDATKISRRCNDDHVSSSTNDEIEGHQSSEIFPGNSEDHQKRGGEPQLFD